MAKAKKDENMSYSDIINDYTVLKEWVDEDGYKHAILRTHSGYTSHCRIPPHTEKENEELSANICEAMIRIACPDIDLSKVKYMEVQF